MEFLLYLIIEVVWLNLSWFTGFIVIKVFTMGRMKVPGPGMAFVRFRKTQKGKLRDIEEIEKERAQWDSEKAIYLGSILWLTVVVLLIVKSAKN